MSASNDPGLDGLFAAVARGAEVAANDDAAWLQRVVSKVSSAGAARVDDAWLASPCPDDADGDGRREFDRNDGARDDHAAHAADPGAQHATDHWAPSLGAAEPSGAPERATTSSAGGFSARGGTAATRGSMEEWMAEEEELPKKNDLGALSGLTRSSLTPPPGHATEIDGAAKGDDSGRIDLRAMMGGGDDKPSEATTAAVGKPDDDMVDIGAIQRASRASSRPDSKEATSAAPSTTAGAAVSAASAKAPPEKKKGGTLVFVGFGLAAAAAVLVGVIAMGNNKKGDDGAVASKAPAAASVADKAKEAPSAVATTSMAVADPKLDPAPPPVASASGEEVAKLDPKAPPGTPGVAVPGPAGPGAGTVATAAPGKAAPSGKPAPTIDPINKPSGGNLDDVLGIGKDDPSKKAGPTADSNLPDKPDAADIRSAVLSKQGAAQSCVKGLDGDSSVAVTFGPSGGVTAVVVTAGPAKGTGAEACIKNAFKNVKVPASKKGGTGYAKLLP